MTLPPVIVSHIFGGLARKILGIELDPFQRGVIKDYNQGKSVAGIVAERFCSASTVNRIIQNAREVGVEVKIRSRGRPPIDRDLILEEFDEAIMAGHSLTESVIYAANKVGCSKITVYRARRGG